MRSTADHVTNATVPPPPPSRNPATPRAPRDQSELLEGLVRRRSGGYGGIEAAIFRRRKVNMCSERPITKGMPVLDRPFAAS
jgi:hypothetical protein